MAIVNMKDSRWLQLEVCREWTRNKCTRADAECKFAHPASGVEVQNGRVVACYDSIKGRCNREKPPCKYFHPPQHLKDQLLINGRNHLALKNALMQTQMPQHLPILGGQMSVVPAVPAPGTPDQQPVCPAAASASAAAAAAAAASVLSSAAFAGPTRVHQVARLQRRKECTSRVAGVALSLSPTDTYAALRKQASSGAYVSLPNAGSAYGGYAPLTLIPGLMSAADQLSNFGAVVHAPSAALVAAKSPPGRSDRLEVCREYQRGNCKRSAEDCRFAHPPDHVHTDAAEGLVTVCMDFVKGRCSRDACRYLHPPPHLQSQMRCPRVPAAAQPSDYAQSPAAALFSLHPVAARPASNPYRL